MKLEDVESYLKKQGPWIAFTGSGEKLTDWLTARFAELRAREQSKENSAIAEARIRAEEDRDREARRDT